MSKENTSPLLFYRARPWAVIGEPRSGKSSTIGALMSQVGRGRGGRRDILLRGGGWLVVHCYRGSAQEANRSPERSVEQIIKTAKTFTRHQPIAYFNVLLALRSAVCNGLPKADHYLAHYIQLGWELQSLVLLGRMDEYDRYARFGAPTAVIDNSTEVLLKQRQRHWVFGAARNHFGWA